MLTPLFWQIHSGLEREGPGDDASLARALGLMRSLPVAPRILDVGCGAGAQTLALLRHTGGRVIAVDTHEPYLVDLVNHADAQGLSQRVTAVNASMADLPFADESFDLIWSEGAIYFIGLREGLKAWRRLLTPGGYIAVTEPCWLKPRDQLPKGTIQAWADYPAMATIDELLPIPSEAGYRLLGHFPLPHEAWWNYYRPIQARIGDLRALYEDDAEKLAELSRHQAEIDAYRAFGDCFSYLFLVMQRPE